MNSKISPASRSDTGGGFSRFRRDSVWLVATSLSQNFFTVVCQICLARLLLSSDFGTYSFFFNLLGIFQLVATAGIRQYLPAISKKQSIDGFAPPLKTLSLGMFISFLFACLNMVLYWGGVYRAFAIDIGPWAVWISAFIIITSLTNLLSSIYIGYGRVRLNFLLCTADEGSKAAGVVLLAVFAIVSFGSVVTIWLGFAAAIAVLSSVIFGNWVHRMQRPFSRAPVFFSRDFTSSLTFLFPSAGAVLIPRLFIFVTGCIYSSSQTAIVAVAVTVMSLFGMILSPFQTALLSHSNAAVTGDGLRRFFLRTAAQSMLLIFALAIITWAVGRLLIVPVFGKEYAGSIGLLVPLVFCFAMEWSKTCLDVFWLSRLSGRWLIALELLKFGAIGLIFLLLQYGSLQSTFIVIGVVFAGINLIKAAAVAFFCKTRCWKS
jgi:O-antigen/teichoic acid export membrane protein